MLSCLSDPLPFQWLANEPERCRSVQFIDVDYEQLIITKKNIIEKTSELRDLIHLCPDSSSDYIVLESEEYLAVGCDLRDIEGLNNAIKSSNNVEECLILCIAEVSTTYMSPTAAD